MTANTMADAETETTAMVLAGTESAQEIEDEQPGGAPTRELLAPGHLYNPRTGTGIEWLPARPGSGEPGNVRLWAREWNGQPFELAEAEHDTASPWEYWYGLEFATSFPQVTHWWFGDAWTGHVRIWRPDGAGVDPESGSPMLMGWVQFGLGGAGDPDFSTAQPWTVVISKPPRINMPLPPMAASLANLPLQLLLGEQVMELLGRLTRLTRLTTQPLRDKEPSDQASLDVKVVLTSLVRREDLQRAFPTHFGSWRLDRLPDLTPREALCRVQGLERFAAAKPPSAATGVRHRGTPQG